MNINRKIINQLVNENITFTVGIPCKLFNNLINILNHDTRIKYVQVTREEEGIGICVGSYLTGNLGLIIMQNSGLGNSVNALASLCNFYHIPVVMFISYRGLEGEKVNAHLGMGTITTQVLDSLNIKYILTRPDTVKEDIAHVVSYARKNQESTALLFLPGVWEKML